MEQVSPRDHKARLAFDDEPVSMEDVTPPSINDIELPKFPTPLKTLCFSIPFIGFLFTHLQVRSLIETENKAHNCVDATRQTFLHIFEVLDKYKKCSLASNLISTALLVIAVTTGFLWPLGCYAMAAVYGSLAYRDLREIKAIQGWIEHYRADLLRQFDLPEDYS